MTNFFYVYVLRSLRDKMLYTGFTRDLAARFKQHQSGYEASTQDRTPFELIYYEACRGKTDAMHREKYLKTFHGKQYLYKRLKSDLTGSTKLKTNPRKKSVILNSRPR